MEKSLSNEPSLFSDYEACNNVGIQEYILIRNFSVHFYSLSEFGLFIKFRFY